MRYRLIALLADGSVQSGQSLGQRLGISRAAVWKHIQALQALGLDVHAVRGRGYRLADPFEPLQSSRVLAGLDASVRERLQALEILPQVDSTSDHLKRDSAPLPEGHLRVCLAEWQSAGRGRRGRRWVSPYGTNLYLSVATKINESGLAAGGLSLVSAIAVAQVLRARGLDGVGVKWPNDIYYQGRKLAGILLDLAGESGGPYRVVIGVGINLKVPDSAARAIDQPWADLSQAGLHLSRSQLAADVINSLAEALRRCDAHGLPDFINSWNELDLVTGRAVELHNEREPMITGIARGIDPRGGLLIEHQGKTRSYHAGEVSLRLS